MAQLDVYNEADVHSDAWGRVLILGDAKAGKTTCVALTAPRPILFINCDGDKSALTGAAHLGARFRAVDVIDERTWSRAIDFALDEAKHERVATIVVDTLTLLADSLVDSLRQHMSGHDLWRKFLETMTGGIRDLKTARAHLVVIAHAAASGNELVGLLPAVPGKSASRIPAMLADWVWLDLDMKTKPLMRSFLVGPQKSWSHGCRNARRTATIDADVSLLFEELGIQP